MSPKRRSRNSADRRRRYVVHLSCILNSESENCRYLARISPSSARTGTNPKYGERSFEDDCELIAAINPVLPLGSDVRDVFGHIESPNGFFYLLWLTHEEALQLGWNESLPSSTSA